MAKNTQGWKTPTGKQALDALKDAKPMSQVYQENFAKAVADKTKELLKQNQKSAEHPTTQVKQATSAATQEPKTTKQKYKEAKKNLSDYTKSDDYRARQQDRNREALKKAQEGMFSTGGTSEAPRSMVFAGQEDAREKELKALVNHYKQQMDAEENQRIRDADMKEIESWSDEDRAALEEYVRARDERDDPLTVSNPFRYILQANKAAKPYSALSEKYGEKRLAELAESYGRVQHEEDAQKIVGDTTAAVSTAGGAIGHNILSVGANGIGGFLGTLGRVNEAFNRTGRYTTLEDYTPGDALSLYASTVRGATTQNIEGENGGVGRKALSVGYQGIMSLADSISRSLALGPAGGAALAATGSFSQTVSEATKQGASPQQAVALGVAKAGMEYVTEKIPMDEVFRIAKSGKTNVLAQAFKQAGVEITTEELSLFGSMAAEAAILQEKSSYKQKIGELVANGANYEEAKEQADKDVWNEVLQTALVSGFAGFLSGYGGAIVGNLAANSAPEVTEEVQQEPPVQTPPEAPVLDEGQQIVDAVAAELAQQAPHPEAQPASPEMERLDMAIAETLGVQPAQQPTVDTVTESDYDNGTVAIPGAAVGRSDVTYTADNKPVQFQYAVVPAESLITSNDQYGNVNSAYPAELQPRDRTRTASQTQINSISRNLNPALLAESPTAQNGAPIIRGDGVVIGGNGRVSAITQAYGTGRGAEYQQFITEKAAELGIDPSTIPENPILVRVTNGVDNYTELANSLNASTTASYSATEAANADASRIGDIIEYLSVSDDGGINNADNNDFIQKFVSYVVPETERGDVMQANGQLSQAGERRIQNALFAYAYGDTALVERLAESTDNNAKNITNAMVATAGKVAKLQTEINRGEAQDLGLQNAITDAVNIYLDAKAGKQTVDDAVGQLSIGENGPEAQYDGLAVHLAKFMEANNRSGLQIRKFIDILVDVNMNMAAETATEVSMFDTVEQQTQEGLYDEAVTAYDQQRDGKGRIPEKSDFSQYRQYQPGELAGSMDGSGTEGNSGTAVSDGGIPQTIQGDVPGGQRNLTEQNPGIKGTGAAEQNFSGKAAYQELLSDENAQRDRKTGVRPVEVPKTDGNGKRVTEFAGNVYSAKVTPDSTANAVESLIQDGKLGFDTRTNQQSLENARQAILENGPDTIRREIASNAENDLIRDGDIEKAMVLYAAYANDPEMQDEASGLIVDIGKIANMSGRNLQLFSLMQRMTPEGQLMAVEKNISRYIEDINKGRSARNKVDASGSNQQAMETATAVEKAREETGKAIDRASKKVIYRKGKVTIEGNQAGEPFVFEYAQKVGEELAKGLERSIRPQKEKTFLQAIAGELKKFASEKIPQKEKKKSLTATDILRDYIQNQEFYNQAWEAAQQTIRDSGEIAQELAEFVNSGIGIDANNNPKNKLFAKALANAAMESGETVQMLKRQEALGFSNMAETIASRLISDTGATGEMEQTIRDAAKSYVNEQLSTDKSNTGKRAKSSEEIVQSSIRSAMQDIQATFSKVAISDAEAKQTVKERIVDKLVKKYGFGKADAGRVADIVGEQYEEMVKSQAEKILKQKFAKKGNKAQKSTEQIFRELANLGAFSPESDYNREATAKVLGDKFDVVISQELADQFLKAKTGEEKQAVMDAIYKDVASNIKPTLGEMWDAWRNLSMLGNFLTHERNIGSTAAWQTFVEVKRDIGAAIEAVALKKQRNKRTKAILGFSENDRALLKWARADAKTQSAKNLMEGSGRTGNEAANEIQKYRKLLPGPFDKLSKGNMDLMGAEDSVFKSHEYSRNLASFLKARGYTAQQLQNGKVPVGVLDQARQHAVQEAKKATFNDQNEFSKQFSNMLGPKANNPAILNVIKKANTPYLRTPANIVHRAWEYSPLSLGKTLITAKSDIDSGRMSASDVIDRVSSGLTGTAAMCLGAALSAGIIPEIKLIAEPTEEEKMEGAVPYSIKIGRKYYPAGWLAPAMIPLFIGARLNENLRRARDESGGVNGWDVVQSVADSFAHSLDPILELSVLSSLKSVLEEVGSYGQFSDKAVSLVVGSTMEYLAQGIPVLFGQMEKAFEPEKKSVYVNTDRSIEKTVKKTIGNVTKRIPGIDLYQTTKLDDAGNPVVPEGNALTRAMDSLFNPIAVSEETSDPVIKEMARLNNTPDIDVKPKNVPKTVSYNDKNGDVHTDIRISEEQYQKWSAAQKKAEYRITHEIVSGPDYKNLTDLQKAKALELAHEYASEQGKRAALDDYPDQSGWMAGIDGKEADAIIQKVNADALDKAISDITKAWKNGWDDSVRIKALEDAYSTFDGMSEEAKDAVREDATGTLSLYLEARDDGMKHKDFMYLLDGIEEVKPGKSHTSDIETYLEIRDQGVSEEQFLSAVGSIAALKPEGEFKNVRKIQKREAIANLNGVPEKIKDVLMKAYMDDGDTTEAEYDYCRNVLDLSPQEYVQVYRVQLDGGKKNEKISKWKSMGYTQEEANIMYRLFAATGKTKIDSIDWADSWK